MAKVKRNNFLETVNEVFTAAKDAGVLHLYAEGDHFSGRTIQVKNKELFHFGTTGYLGLEQDIRLKQEAIAAIQKYGTQFPLSRTYISHPLYKTLSFPKKLFEMMSKDPNWEFIVLYLDHDLVAKEAVAVMFCYKNEKYTYVPAFVGLDYQYLKEYQTYRQLLYQTIKRAKLLNFQKINFGMTAAFEKRKLGAKVITKVAYLQAKDNFSMEMIEAIDN